MKRERRPECRNGGRAGEGAGGEQEMTKKKRLNDGGNVRRELGNYRKCEKSRMM